MIGNYISSSLIDSPDDLFGNSLYYDCLSVVLVLFVSRSYLADDSVFEMAVSLWDVMSEPSLLF